ncbi:uncharacterized protein LOC127857040 isoform X1 [Dreissena polymorpha]|nr:uncharacterized protein LOC127857040 isoform X1 [Dreissena polymorpha]
MFHSYLTHTRIKPTMPSSDSSSSDDDSGSSSSSSSSESEPPVMSPKKTGPSNNNKGKVDDETDEPDAAGDNQQKKVNTDSFKWTTVKIMELVHVAMLNCDPGQLSFMPYDQVIVDWDVVARTVDLPRAKCEEKWKVLLKSTRHFRTLPEVITDVVLQHHKSDLFQHNKHVDQGNSSKSTETKKSVEPKKTRIPVNTNHPVKPKLSAYSYFCEEKAKAVPESGVHKMIRLGVMWKTTDEQEKARYQKICDERKEAYLREVKSYATLHPEDLVIQHTLAELRKSDERKRKEEGSKAKVKNGAVLNTDSPKKKSKPVENDSSSQEDLNKTLPVVSNAKTPVKRHHSDTELSAKKKKKKKEKKARREAMVTAEDVYIEERFDDYKISKPDMEDNDIKARLTHKFGKMSDKKKAKYEALAAERNG